MIHKHIIRDGLRGIVIFLEMEELLNHAPISSDILVEDKIYLQLDGVTSISRHLSTFWIVEGIRKLAKEICNATNNLSVCFIVKNIDYNACHFQVEGLYCAVQEWLAIYYKFDIPKVDVYYDHEKKKFIFPELPVPS
jgi:hypothetical protein